MELSQIKDTVERHLSGIFTYPNACLGTNVTFFTTK